MSKLIAVIPARGGSKGLPNKNILTLHDRPLIYWSIAFAQAHSSIDRCIVSTDSLEISQIAKRYGAEVPYLRSPSLSSDTAKSSDVIMDLIYRCSLDKSDKILLLEPTSPYRKTVTFKHMLNCFESYVCEKAVSVSEAVSSSYIFQYQINFENLPLMKPVQESIDSNGLRRQDIGKTYYLDGSFYMATVDSFLKDPGFLCKSTFAILSDYFSSFEIDCQNDLLLMEAIFDGIGVPF